MSSAFLILMINAFLVILLISSKWGRPKDSASLFVGLLFGVLFVCSLFLAIFVAKQTTPRLLYQGLVYGNLMVFFMYLLVKLHVKIEKHIKPTLISFFVYLEKLLKR